MRRYIIHRPNNPEFTLCADRQTDIRCPFRTHAHSHLQSVNHLHAVMNYYFLIERKYFTFRCCCWWNAEFERRRRRRTSNVTENRWSRSSSEFICKYLHFTWTNLLHLRFRKFYNSISAADAKFAWSSSGKDGIYIYVCIFHIHIG